MNLGAQWAIYLTTIKIYTEFFRSTFSPKKKEESLTEYLVYTYHK